MITKLNYDESDLIRAACQIQIDSLQELISDEDLTLYSAMEELEEQELRETIERRLAHFIEAKEVPEYFLSYLDEKDLSTFTHIIENYFEEPRYEQAKKRIWRKMIINENFNLLFNLN